MAVKGSEKTQFPLSLKRQQIELFYQAGVSSINYFPISMLNCTGHASKQNRTHTHPTHRKKAHAQRQVLVKDYNY